MCQGLSEPLARWLGRAAAAAPPPGAPTCSRWRARAHQPRHSAPAHFRREPNRTNYANKHICRWPASIGATVCKQRARAAAGRPAAHVRARPSDWLAPIWRAPKLERGQTRPAPTCCARARPKTAPRCARAHCFKVAPPLCVWPRARRPPIH